MYPISFKLGSFGPDVELNKRILGHLLEALTAIDVDILKKNPALPGLYESGVRYRREPVGQEDWDDIVELYRIGYGDCEDLSAARAAELRVRHGIAARPYVKGPKRLDNGLMLYHVQVQLPDGRILDPSVKLGMGSRPVSPAYTYTIAQTRGIGV
jgi:hypothetical protein